MPDRCAVFGCSNRANSAERISLHRIPFYGDERPEAKRRRKIWVNFVARKRARWTPTKYSAVYYCDGKVIWAKFKSFLSHIVDKHTNLDNPLFSSCFHGPDIKPREYLLEGSVAHEKLSAKLLNPQLMKSIHQASPVAQTSCLEGFLSVLNHFAPKMIHYSYVGMYCRHILASIHFNNNLRHDVKMKNDGTFQINVVYPKFKNGEGTVRDVRVKSKFEYVDELFESVMLSIKDKDALSNSQNLLKEMSPPSMNVMLQKQPRAEVLLKQVR
ncbi:uncharacterized protein LOC124458281 [Xenia sp. Carnegie-2017]|uniref:uncharacterized protein LOC124458281 n=1 Tax=Xenia sp. Carnegie-2017 TaxID=2897299 RepID=UPI001F0494CC|nr:uncharacterized protein LOC124458281 [Xenia sp. Carnegie-2017]XP_046864282.1 uncharacterized protein LOC124458281 [Xenia sp. Carnegie-2017]